jgi:hypothetical protein
MRVVVGDFVDWNCSIGVLIEQTSKAKLNPNCLLIVGIDDNKAQAVLCWYNAQKYSMRIYTNKGDVYVSANVYLTLDVGLLDMIADLKLVNISSIDYIKRKHNEILVKEQLKSKIKREKKNKKELAKKIAIRKAIQIKHEKTQKRLYGSSSDAWKYEMAVINNDKRTIRSIEKKVGHDPRPRVGCKSGSNLKQIDNPKPCIGGRVSPK